MDIYIKNYKMIVRAGHFDEAQAWLEEQLGWDVLGEWSRYHEIDKDDPACMDLCLVDPTGGPSPFMGEKPAHNAEVLKEFVERFGEDGTMLKATFDDEIVLMSVLFGKFREYSKYSYEVFDDLEAERDGEGRPSPEIVGGDRDLFGMRSFIAFVLGRHLLSEPIDQLGESACCTWDTAYPACMELAARFMESDLFKSSLLGLGEALPMWVAENEAMIDRFINSAPAENAGILDFERMRRAALLGGSQFEDPLRRKSDYESQDWMRGFDDGFASADDFANQNEEAMNAHGWFLLDSLTVDDLPPALVEQAFRKQEKSYRIQDARRQFEDYVEDHPYTYAPAPSEEELEALAKQFLHIQDCNLKENSVWEYIIESYVYGKQAEIDGLCEGLIFQPKMLTDEGGILEASVALPELADVPDSDLVVSVYRLAEIRDGWPEGSRQASEAREALAGGAVYKVYVGLTPSESPWDIPILDDLNVRSIQEAAERASAYIERNAREISAQARLDDAVPYAMLTEWQKSKVDSENAEDRFYAAVDNNLGLDKLAYDQDKDVREAARKRLDEINGIERLPDELIITEEMQRTNPISRIHEMMDAQDRWFAEHPNAKRSFKPEDWAKQVIRQVASGRGGRK